MSFKQLKTWDFLTRFWHWMLVLTLTSTWLIGKNMSFENISWHFYLGYLILALIVIRLIRGFIGPVEIRFNALIFSPRQIISYIRTLPQRTPSGTRGHNPIGSLSVLAMIFLILAQAISGLFIESDDFFEYGPLTQYVSETTIHQLTWWHHTLADILLIVVAMHITAILFYLFWKKENLIKPMINGLKTIKTHKEGNDD